MVAPIFWTPNFQLPTSSLCAVSEEQRLLRQSQQVQDVFADRLHQRPLAHARRKDGMGPSYVGPWASPVLVGRL